ncbi:MAG: general secretion pathway protein GspB [Parashewanella sp.]
MSILLNAVTKNKQQQSNVVDPALSPRQQYQQLHQGQSWVLKATMVAMAIATGLAGAWWLSSSGQTQAISTQVAQSTINVEVDEKTAVEQPPVENTEVELAGKVALPLAQAYQPRQKIEVLSSKQQVLTQAKKIEPQEQITTINTNANEPQVAAELSAKSNGEPIVLGAAPKQDDTAALDELKRQVELAASNVGMKSADQIKQDKLVASFQEALSNVEHKHTLEKKEPDASNTATHQQADKAIPKYGELPAGLQLQVPEFNINAHMYSSNASQRRLSVDGKEMKEGDKIRGKLKIIEIRPRDVVLEVAGTKFKVPAI